MKPKQIFTKEDKALRLSWRGVLALIAATFALGLLFDHYEVHAPMRPLMFAAATIGSVLTLRWRLRHHLWFWIVLSIVAAFHVAVIFMREWSDQWVPAAALTPFGMIDVYAMLVALAAIERSKAKAGLT